MLDKLIYPIILSGGLGTRLWPISRKTMPKQFNKLFGDKSPFQETILRYTGDLFYQPIVVTGNNSRFHVKGQLNEINVNKSSILIEPLACDTAPAIISGIIHANTISKNPIVLITPSDHWIKNDSSFKKLILKVSENFEQDKIYTFGIAPTHPHTGYGWIKTNEPFNSTKEKGFDVELFIEKPNYNKASSMLKNKSFFWNCGIFFGRAEVFINEYEKYIPSILHNVAESYQNLESDLSFLRLNEKRWDEMEKISIDHAIMEQSKNLKVVPFFGEWSDIGTWKNLMDQCEQDTNGNVSLGEVTAVDCKETFLHSVDSNIHLVGLGLDKLIAVATQDAVLVTNKEKTEDVKIALKKLADKNIEQASNSIYDHRPWGNFKILSKGSNFLVKKIEVNPKSRLSLQSHKYRAEHWVVVQGKAEVTLDNKVFSLNKNQSIYIETGKKHRLENKTSGPLVIIEIQTGSVLDESDILRFEDDYMRNN